MAGIVLKDGNGKEIEYDLKKHIKVPYRDDDGVMSEMVFSHMSGLSLYYYLPLGDAIQITKKVITWASDDIWFIGLDEATLKEYGKQNSDGTYGIHFFISRNGNLVAGQTYTTDEIIGGI